MADELHNSPTWHRVAPLKPRIRAHINLLRHGFRNQVWYVLEDRAAGRYFRFSPTAYRIISRLDGNTSIDTIWHETMAEPGNEGFERGDMVRLLAQLHRAGALHGDTAPDIGELVDRAEEMGRKKRIMQALNPLAIRVPLIDPERFIAATFPLVRPLYSVFGFVLIIGLIFYGALQASVHWDDLTGNLSDRILTFQNFALLLIAYPLIKLVHELGHAYAVKRWGGEVHELGVMMLVFMPVPYVDASAAAAFPSKWARAIVGAAGIIVELALAAIAMLIWIEIEPGLMRAFLFNIMLIGGVSTLLFNGNPLLKFDGYYVMSDLVEIPNMGQRANRYYRYLFMGKLFGSPAVTSPATAPGEARWFAIYAPAALIYRIFVMVAIIFLVAGQAFFVGVALAIWAVLLMYGLPLFKIVKALFVSPDLRGHRARALGITGAALAVIIGALSLIPVPLTTLTEGVVSSGPETQIVTETDGFVATTFAQTDRATDAAIPVLTMSDPFLDAREATLRTDLREIESRLRNAAINDLAGARILEEQREHARADLARAVERRENLEVSAPGTGDVVLLAKDDLPGQFLRKGTLVGYVVEPARFVIDVVVPEARVDLLNAATDAIDIRLASDPSTALTAEMRRATPSAISTLPNSALSSLAGGPVVTDPGDPEARRTLSPTFQLQLEPTQPLASSLIGQRVFVRFDHGYEPLAGQMYRALRQLFLARFNV